MKVAYLLVVLALTGCAADQPKLEPRVEIKFVDRVVPVKCTVDIGQDPAFPDTDAAIADARDDIFTLAKLYRTGRLLRIARMKELKAALSGCTN